MAFQFVQHGKPIYQSRKFWVAVISALAAVYLEHTGNTAMAQIITVLGGLLLSGIAIEDHGKARAIIERDSRRG